MTEYLYDADGTRVAKGTIPGVTLSSFSSLGCDPSAWTGFQFTTDYVLGTAGEELTEMSNNGGTWQWALTNVYAAGKLIGTYNMVSNGQGAQVPWLHFHLEDPLGTRRTCRFPACSPTSASRRWTAKAFRMGTSSTATPTPTPIPPLAMQHRSTTPAKNGTQNQGMITSLPATMRRNGAVHVA